MIKKLLSVIIIVCFFACKQGVTNAKLSGSVFGTTYSVIYNSDINYQKQFDSLFYVVNKSMSTYQVNSDISKLNRNEAIEVDAHFIKVFNTSQEIYKETQGAFDPTIGTIVNALGFGPEQKVAKLDSIKIDSLMQYVSFDNVYIANRRVIKKHPQTFIDFNAIAKGYGVDVIAEFLESKNITNYLVEIGGEIHCKGQNIEKQSAWKVGIDTPRFDGEQSVLKAITLKNESMATSGTYRKFKIDKNGNRYSHIIDAKTGYSSKTNVLSVSVIAKNCMIADAYATAFKAMGIEKVASFLKTHPELKVFFVFENEKQELETLSLNGFPEK